MTERDAASAGTRGAIVVWIGQATKLLVVLVATFVLARILTPADFGLIAMVSVFTALALFFGDFGLSTAALQAPELNRKNASNLFWINFLAAVAAALILSACAHLIANLYQDERVVTIIYVLAIVIILNGMQTQLKVQLSRSMKFLSLTVAEVGSLVVGFAVAIIAALNGWGYWSLVCQLVVTALVCLVATAVLSKWVPVLPSKTPETGQLVKAGIDYGVVQIANVPVTQIGPFLLGLKWNPTEVGLFSRAYDLAVAPVAQFVGPMIRVVLPTTGRLESQGSDLRPVFLRIQRLLGAGIIGAFLVGILAADWLIPLAFGDQWFGSIIYFKILAIAGCFDVVTYPIYWILMRDGQSRSFLHLSLYRRAVSLLVIVALALIINKPQAVAVGYTLASVLGWALALVWLSKRHKYPSIPLFKGGIQLLGVGAIALGVGWLVFANVDGLGLLGSTAVSVGAAVIVYLGFSYQNRALRQDVTSLIGQIKKRPALEA